MAPTHGDCLSAKPSGMRRRGEHVGRSLTANGQDGAVGAHTGQEKFQCSRLVAAAHRSVPSITFDPESRIAKMNLHDRRWQITEGDTRERCQAWKSLEQRQCRVSARRVYGSMIGACERG